MNATRFPDVGRSCLFVLLVSLPAAAAVPDSPAPVFNTPTLLRGVTLTAPLSDLFRETKDVLDGWQISTPKPKLPKARATLRVVNAAGMVETFDKVEVEARGHSSLLPDQCAFPKLTLKLPKSTKGTSLNGLKAIKIGTHCGEQTGSLPQWGRIGNEREPIREALAYEVLRRAGVVSLLARPVEITYTDTSKQRSEALFPQNPLTRKAFFLEDDAEAAARYGGKVIQKSEESAIPDSSFDDAMSSHIDPLNVAMAILGETLLDNGDYFIRLWPHEPVPARLARYSNYNVNIISDRSKHRLIQIYDWDTTGWVAATSDVGGGRFQRAVDRLRADPAITASALDAAADAFRNARQDLYDAVDALFATEGVQDDPAGRAQIADHLNAFFRFLGSLPSGAADRGAP